MHMRSGWHAHAAMYAPPSMRAHAHASFRQLLGCASTSLINHQRRRTDCKIDHHTHARYAQRNCTTGGQTTLMANLMLTKYEKVGWSVIHDAQFLLPPMEPLFPGSVDFTLFFAFFVISVCGIACSRFHSQVRVEEGGCKWKTT
jgi:hypothetical protein